MTPPPDSAGAVVAARHRADDGWTIINEFIEILAMPNVTGQVDDLRSNANDIVRRFGRRGASMEVVEIPGASPVVVGELRTENPTATLGVYVHYDGQPVDPANWSTDPYRPTLASAPWHDGGRPLQMTSSAEIDPEWRLYARSSSDDKTPLIAILAAIDALDHAGMPRTIDLVFLFDGEEESGSPNLEQYMGSLGDRLAADAWLLCDGPVHQSRRPQVAFGARGYCGFDLTFYGPERELHSGHYGNWVPNPAFELASFLASCKDEDGRVTIDGFYDTTTAISDADRAAIANLPEIEPVLREQLGFGGSEMTTGRYEESLMLPSFNVRGLRAADVGDHARNVIPATATASVDIRLAAGDDPLRMIELVQAALTTNGYLVVDREPTPAERRSARRLARLEPGVGYRAARTPMDSPLASALTQICTTAAGEKAIALPTFGGSIPLYLFEDIFGAPVAVLPIANHDNNQHAPDENIRIANLWYGIDLWATILTSNLENLRTG